MTVITVLIYSGKAREALDDNLTEVELMHFK